MFYLLISIGVMGVIVTAVSLIKQVLSSIEIKVRRIKPEDQEKYIIKIKIT